MTNKFYYGKMKMYKSTQTGQVYSPEEVETAMSSGSVDEFAMDAPVGAETAVIPPQPTEEKPNWVQMMSQNSTNITIVLLLITILLAFGIVIAANGFKWLYELKPVEMGELGEISIVLAPLLALALAIERFVETLFDYFEGEVRNIARIADISKEGIEELEANLNSAWVDYNNAANLTVEALGAAEAKLKGISEIFLGLPKNPIYVSYKRRFSIAISFMIGFVVAVFTDQGMFEYLQISVPRILDMLVTGAALGAGAGPMHSIVGALDGLQSSLKAVGNRQGINEVLDEVRRMRVS